MANPFSRMFGMGGPMGTWPGTPGINPNAPMPGVMTGPGGFGGFGGPIQQPQQAPQAPPRFAGPPWLQKIAGGFNNAMGNMAGGQSPQAQQAFMAALLANSGPAPKGARGLLQPFGAAMQAGQQAQFAVDENEMRKQLIQAQIAAAQKPSQDRADPAALREMQALGYPMTQEGFKQYNLDRAERAGSGYEEINARLAVMEREDRLARERAEEARAGETRERERTTLGNTLKRSVNQTADIAGLVEGLEGSFLSAGLPASSWRRTAASAWAGLAGAAGADTSKLEADIGKFDKLKKGLSDQLINLMSTGGLGEATNSKLEQYQNALANTETSPPAILSIQAGIAETLLEAADAQGFEIEGRDKIEENIRKWRAYESGSSAVDVSQMTDEQLRQIVNGK